MTSDIKVGRLLKKIEKLKKQRDFHKARHEHYATVISLQPHLETRYKSYEERVRNQNEIEQMKRRVEEQEALIRILLKDNPLCNYEITALYSALIKEEYKKLNIEAK